MFLYKQDRYFGNINFLRNENETKKPSRSYLKGFIWVGTTGFSRRDPCGGTAEHRFAITTLWSLLKRCHTGQVIRIGSLIQATDQIKRSTASEEQRSDRFSVNSLKKCRHEVLTIKKSLHTKKNICMKALPESGRQDLNLRPLDPQPSALPDWATSRT